MQNYELKDNSIDQYIAIAPKKQIIGALAKEESYVFQQHSSSYTGTNETPENTTPDQSKETLEELEGSGSWHNVAPNSKIAATDYIGAFAIDVPFIIDPLYTDFKVLNLQTSPFSNLHPSKEKNSLWEDLFDSNDNNRLGTLFNGNQLLRIPANRFNTITVESTITVNVVVTKGSEVLTFLENDPINLSLQTALKVGMVLATITSSISFVGENDLFFDNTKIVKIIGLGGNKIIMSSPALDSTSLTGKTTLVFKLANSIEKNYGKYYLKISPKYVDFQIVTIKYGNKYSQQEFASEFTSKTPPTDPTTIPERTTYYKLKFASPEDETVFTNWGIPAHSEMDGLLLGSLCEIRQDDGNGNVKIKGQKIIGENTYNETTSGTPVSITLQPNLIGEATETTDVNSFSSLPSTSDTLRVYLKDTYFTPIFIELNYKTGVSVEDLIMFLMNDAVRDTKTGIMEIYDDNGIIINNGVVDGAVAQSYQFSLQNNLEIRKKINLG